MTGRMHASNADTSERLQRTLNVLREEGRKEQFGVLAEVQAERARQEAKWGEQNHPSVDQVLVNRPGGCTPDRMCEQYEIPSEPRAKFLCNENAERGTLTYGHIALEEFCEAIAAHDDTDRRAELVQLAAVCVAWIESIDRRSARLQDEKGWGE